MFRVSTKARAMSGNKTCVAVQVAVETVAIWFTVDISLLIELNVDVVVAKISQQKYIPYFLDYKSMLCISLVS